MKKLLLIVVFVLGLMSAKAQNKYLDSTCEWRYLAVGGLPTHYTLITKYLDGDTLISNKVFYKVYVRDRSLIITNYNTPMTFTYKPDTSKAGLTFLLREDSLHNFLVCSNNSLNQVSMLYNFDSIINLDINDYYPQNTILLPDNCFSYDGYSSNCSVVYKDTFYLGTKMLLGFSTTSNPYTGYAGVIEGVGSGYSFICPYIGCVDGPDTKLCYYSKKSDTLKLFIPYPYDSFPKAKRTNKFTSLPLKLLSFSAQKESNNVLLNWQTTNELNVSHFNIQRSNNGKDFTAISKVNIGISPYSFTDKLTTNYSLPASLYYRLEMVDKDGSKTYSDVKNINYKPQTVNGFSIYPNPATAMVSIECKDAKEILIIDYLGKTVKQIINPTQSQSINTKQLYKGVYIVKALMNNGEIKTEKLIVE